MYLPTGLAFKNLKVGVTPHKIGCKSRRNSGIKQLERASNGELRRSLKQAAGIRVNRSVRDQVSAANFYNFSLIHHRDARRKIAHYRHGVRDKKIGQTEIPLQLRKKIYDLRAHADVEGGN